MDYYYMSLVQCFFNLVLVQELCIEVFQNVFLDYIDQVLINCLFALITEQDGLEQTDFELIDFDGGELGQDVDVDYVSSIEIQHEHSIPFKIRDMLIIIIPFNAHLNISLITITLTDKFSEQTRKNLE